MTYTHFDIAGPVRITNKCYPDGRGFFTERFRTDKWSEVVSGHPGFIQDNYSWSKYGVLRGLHFQLLPAQGKLVTCLSGSITDIIVDIRRDSPTLGLHIKVELSGDEPSWLWVPPGFAHGFLVTSPDGAGVMYKVDQPYAPKTEGSIRWNDPDLRLPWPISQPGLSAKDQNAPSFKDYLAMARF